jgi:hypothetical protein
VQRRLDDTLFAGAILVMSALLAVVGAALLFRSGLTYQINYNEGWNSYFTARVLEGLPLYPERSTHLINNYPPLSFYMVAILSKLTGNVLVAGRIAAWFGYVGCAALIGLIARRLGTDSAGAAFGALFFATLLAVRCDLYVGMFDPQLPAQAIMLAALLTLLQGSTGATMAAAGLLVAGGFMKHSLIGLPIAITVWLLLYRRRQLVSWILGATVFAVAGLAICVAAFGSEFLAGLTMPRRLSWPDGARKVFKWLFPLHAACLLAFLPSLLGGAEAAFIAIYLTVSLITGLLGAALMATNYNMVFELLVGVSLGIGLLAGRSSRNPPRGWVALAAVASLVLTAGELATAETANPRTWVSMQTKRDAEARRVVAALRATAGPALCGTLLYCFQAGKPFIWDPLNYGQFPGENQAFLQLEIAERRFGTVQIDLANSYFTAETEAAILANYREIAETKGVYRPLR